MLALMLLLACHKDEVVESAACSGYVPTWEGWTHGFFRTWCTSCHGTFAVERNGAPIGVDFDSEAGALRWRERIRERVLVDGTMPIGGGVYAEDLALLEAWLDCAGEDGDSTGDTVSELPEPAWSADEARAALEAALTLPLGDPLTARDTFLGLFSYGDEACPDAEDYNLPVSRSGCTSARGWTFAGPSTYEIEEGAGLINFVLWNDCEILGPGDEAWRAGGSIAFYRAEDAGRVEWALKQGGTWSWSEDRGWLGLGSSSSLGASGLIDGAAYTVDFDGVTTQGGYTLDLRGVHLDSASCARGTGELALRDPNGGWYTLLLGEDCGGCGTLRYGGLEHGNLCVNVVAPLRDLSEAVMR